jgi:hypothetical protein
MHPSALETKADTCVQSRQNKPIWSDTPPSFKAKAKQPHTVVFKEEEKAVGQE